MTDAAPGMSEGIRIGDARRAEAFRAAGRHTSRVRFMKRAIVGSAIAGALGLAFVAFFNPFRNLPENVSISSIGVNGSRITMELPKLNGYRKDSRPYEVTAKQAIQDLKKQNMIELVDLEARIEMADHGQGRVTARTGFYDTGKETMQLVNDVRMKSDSGYEVLLTKADIDFKAGTMASNEPVRVLMRTSTIRADRMNVIDGGKTLVFEGRVKTMILPESEADAAAAQMKGTTQ